MSLLIIHAPTTNPTPFLDALPVQDTTWEINNKYYTARVNVLVHPLEAPWQGESEAVIYLYDSDPTPPEQLQDIIRRTEPELRFAIRLPSSSSDSDGHDSEAEEDAWDGRGIEYVDLSRLHASEDADGAINAVRDSLQTILWPGMTRKPLHPQTKQPRESVPNGDAPTKRHPASTSGNPRPFDMPSAEEPAFLEREQAKLDTWLDTNDGAFPISHCTSNDPPGFTDDFLPRRLASSETDEFGAFQSASSLARREPDSKEDEDDPLFPSPMDPTHLLTHLQSLRTELSGVPDDVRRARAAREVERLFSGLGVRLEGLDLEESDSDSEGVGEVNGGKVGVGR
ncbi:hypothetical protein QFC20_004345 [Naganishia adeliensis]|uniref:Uncharacterized protein n=1 Tax=Naganishia adeliensis TaxID=92952 RepID=A0ACC2W281_9TREE|nr:hypothetical protein QFC20_004345 [Naganishia adeliensis]